MTQEDDGYYGDDDFEDDNEEAPCDYGADTPCLEPALRNIGCCFECWLYQEMCEEQEKAQEDKKAKP